MIPSQPYPDNMYRVFRYQPSEIKAYPNLGYQYPYYYYPDNAAQYNPYAPKRAPPTYYPEKPPNAPSFNQYSFKRHKKARSLPNLADMTARVNYPIYRTDGAFPRIDIKKYSTSTIDPLRNYLTVYEYQINGHWVIWDYSIGYVHLTGIWKAALSRANSNVMSGLSLKADIVKLLELTPKPYHPYIKRIRGGFLKIQGTWLPYSLCKLLARRFCYHIRHELVPIFGADFVDLCLKPLDYGYGELRLDDVSPEVFPIKRDTDINDSHQVPYVATPIKRPNIEDVAFTFAPEGTSYSHGNPKPYIPRTPDLPPKEICSQRFRPDAYTSHAYAPTDVYPSPYRSEKDADRRLSDTDKFGSPFHRIGTSKYPYHEGPYKVGERAGSHKPGDNTDSGLTSYMISFQTDNLGRLGLPDKLFKSDPFQTKTDQMMSDSISIQSQPNRTFKTELPQFKVDPKWYDRKSRQSFSLPQLKTGTARPYQDTNISPYQDPNSSPYTGGKISNESPIQRSYEFANPFKSKPVNEDADSSADRNGDKLDFERGGLASPYRGSRTSVVGTTQVHAGGAPACSGGYAVAPRTDAQELRGGLAHKRSSSWAHQAMDDVVYASRCLQQLRTLVLQNTLCEASPTESDDKEKTGIQSILLAARLEENRERKPSMKIDDLLT